MGAYLSSPVTEKISSDELNQFLSCGASSMQGWRISQEDAHNCLLDFDTNTSFFSVYDGHGGAEVAAYCAQKLPEFLKQLDSYKKGEFETALQEAFLGFDATLLEENVIKVLKTLAKKNPDDEETSEEEDDDENIADLCSEARMPLNEVLEKYKDNKLNPVIDKLKAEGVGSSKPVSPFLRGKRCMGGNDEGAGGSGSSSAPSPRKTNNSAAAAASSTSSASGSTRKVLSMDEDDAVSSSSSKVGAGSLKAKVENAEACSSSVSAENEVNNHKPDSENPDISSSSTKSAKSDATAVVTENGDAAKEATSEPSTTDSSSKAADVSSSSSGGNGAKVSQENGEISSGSSGSPKKAVANSITSSSIKAAGMMDEEDDDDDDDDSSVDDEYDENAQSSDDDGEELDEEDTEEEDADDELNEEDEEFINSMVDEPGKDSGCTAVVALLHGKDLYVANAGDSRCVVCRKGEAVDMSFDHKPEDTVERDRITKAGGRVTLDGRVNGGLNLSRAIGDHGYKTNKALKPEEQMISALPDIKKLQITAEDEFMVLACDGIWNFMTSAEVVAFVKERLDKDSTQPMSKICEQLFEKCLAPNTMGDGTGCDNMTAIIVQFKSTFTQNGSADAAAPSRKRTASVDDSPTTNGEKGDDEAKRLKLDSTEKATVAVAATETAEAPTESGISSSS